MPAATVVAKPTLPVRLSGKTYTFPNGSISGILQLFHARSGLWGSVCEFNDESVPDAYADVACRQMGYASGSWSPFPADAYRPLGYTYKPVFLTPMVLDWMRCKGTEASADKCARSAWGSEDTNCDYLEEAVVTCHKSEWMDGCRAGRQACL